MRGEVRAVRAALGVERRIGELVERLDRLEAASRAVPLRSVSEAHELDVHGARMVPRKMIGCALTAREVATLLDRLARGPTAANVLPSQRTASPR